MRSAMNGATALRAVTLATLACLVVNSQAHGTHHYAHSGHAEHTGVADETHHSKMVHHSPLWARWMAPVHLGPPLQPLRRPWVGRPSLPHFGFNFRTSLPFLQLSLKGDFNKKEARPEELPQTVVLYPYDVLKHSKALEAPLPALVVSGEEESLEAKKPGQYAVHEDGQDWTQPPFDFSKYKATVQMLPAVDKPQEDGVTVQPPSPPLFDFKTSVEKVKDTLLGGDASLKKELVAEVTQLASPPALDIKTSVEKVKETLLGSDASLKKELVAEATQEASSPVLDIKTTVEKVKETLLGSDAYLKKELVAEATQPASLPVLDIRTSVEDTKDEDTVPGSDGFLEKDVASIYKDTLKDADDKALLTNAIDFRIENGLNASETEEESTTLEPMERQGVDMTPEALIKLLPVIVHDLRNGSVEEKEKEVLSRVFGKLWPFIERLAEDRSVSIADLFDLDTETRLEAFLGSRFNSDTRVEFADDPAGARTRRETSVEEEDALQDLLDNQPEVYMDESNQYLYEDEEEGVNERGVGDQEDSVLQLVAAGAAHDSAKYPRISSRARLPHNSKPTVG